MNYGELIQLGRHKLMCGDATRREDVMRLVEGERVNLVLTDPPYGINVVDRKTGQLGRNSMKYAPCIGDIGTDMARENYRILRGVCNFMIIWGGQNFTEFLPPSCGGYSGTKKRIPKIYHLAMVN